MRKNILSFIVWGIILIGVVGCGTNTNQLESKSDLTKSTTSSITTTTESTTTSTPTSTTTKKVASTKSTTTKPKKTKKATSSSKSATKKSNSSTKSVQNATAQTNNINQGTNPTQANQASTTTTTAKPTTKSLSEKEVYDAMIALKSKYPTGTPWDNSNFYAWKGGIYNGGEGCAAFAFMLSDAAFGNRKARQVNTLDNLKVGDIIRYLNDTHFVIVLNISGDTLTLAEGNMNSAVYWGRKITITEIKKTFNYVLTRW